MKVVLFIIAFCVSAAAQIQYIPCIVDKQTYGPGDRTLVVQNGMWVPRKAPIWQPVQLPSTVLKLNAGTSWNFAVSMPVNGKCRVTFDSKDDRPDLAKVATDALGRRIGVPIKPPGDIEIVIVDEFGFTEFSRGRSYMAYYSSGRSFAGTFDAPLPRGVELCRTVR